MKLPTNTVLNDSINAVAVSAVDQCIPESAHEVTDAADSARRFAGTARLYGASAAHRFAATHIAVVGLGGVGSWAAEALARSGIGALTLIDLDHIAESNVNRQVHAIDGQLGRAKVEAMAERIAGIHPSCVLRVIDDFLTADNAAELLTGCRGVIDAIDAIDAKTALAAHCRSAQIPLVVCGGAGGKRDLTRLRFDDLAQVRNDALLAKLRARLRREHGFPRGDVGRRPAPLGIACAYLDEPAQPSDAVGTGLHCAGYGSAMHATAGLGLLAVGQMLDWIAIGSVLPA